MYLYIIACFSNYCTISSTRFAPLSNMYRLDEYCVLILHYISSTYLSMIDNVKTSFLNAPQGDVGQQM